MRTPPRTIPMVMALILVIAACGGDGADTTTSAATGTTEATGTTVAPGTTEAPGPSGEPIVVGSTLALTGAFGATGNIHRIAGEMFVERLNARGGLLGRPVEWRLLDDESDGTRIAELYEQLISQEGVDLVIGPYATPNILAAMPVTERYGYVLPHHTSVFAPAMTYQCQFPGWSIGHEPNNFIPNQIADAMDSLEGAVSTLAIVTNGGGSTSFVTNGVLDDPDDPSALTVFPARGYEVVADIEYPPGNTEWGSIAAEVRAADPDLLAMMSLGVEANGLIEAMAALNYAPPMMFALFPAPGPLLGMGEASEGLLSVSIFEPNEPILDAAGSEIRDLVEEFSARADADGIPYTVFETQAAASWNTWEILVAGVEGSGSLDNAEICNYLVENGAELTFGGNVGFDPELHNFWPTNQVLKQIQDGDWVVVWPEEAAAADLRGPAS